MSDLPARPGPAGGLPARGVRPAPAAKTDRLRWLVRSAFVGCLLPLAWLALRALRNDLGANPIAEATNRLGFYAFVLLLLTLACTPLQLILKQAWPVRLRKLLGDFCFFYASLHLLTWAGLDQAFDLRDIGKDIAKRSFILVGLATWLTLLPLAVTSTQGWVKRLGYRRWKTLHRIVYVSGALACVHFLWRFKTALVEPLAWTACFVALMAIRVAYFIRKRTRAPAPARE